MLKCPLLLALLSARPHFQLYPFQSPATQTSSPILVLTPPKSEVACVCSLALRSKIFLSLPESTSPATRDLPSVDHLLFPSEPFSHTKNSAPLSCISPAESRPTPNPKPENCRCADVQPKTGFPCSSPCTTPAKIIPLFLSVPLRLGTRPPHPSPPSIDLVPLAAEAVPTFHHPHLTILFFPNYS